jgi:AraC-like DNA-binding protein
MTAASKNMTSETQDEPRLAGSTVSAGYVRALADFAVSKGADRAELLRRSGLSADEIADVDARVAMARYIAMFDAAIALTGDPAIALHYGKAVRMQEISIVGLICEACERTIDVGTQLNRYGRLVFDQAAGEDFVRGVSDESGVWMVMASNFFHASPYIAEAEMARLVWNTRLMFKDHAEFQSIGFPIEITFMHAKPSYGEAFDQVFQAPVTFGAKRSAARLDPRFLTLNHPPFNRYVFGVLSERAEALLKSLESAKTMRGQVEALLIPILHTEEPSMERIAEKVGVSHRTLYRQLKAEGTTFEKLLDELRHKMALHYLDGKKVSVNETAYLVGFSEPSAFSRAFRRWTGVSPRKRML